MATSESESAEVGAQSPSMNEIAVRAIRQGIAEQASRQEEFQLSVRVQGSADEAATKAFQEDLIEFVKRKVEAGDVTVPEVAIALWEEVNRMEEMVREASEELEDDASDDENDASDDENDASDDENGASDDGDNNPIADLTGQPSTDDAEDADADADSGLPEDPAFH